MNIVKILLPCVQPTEEANIRLRAHCDARCRPTGAEDIEKQKELQNDVILFASLIVGSVCCSLALKFRLSF